MTDVTGMSDGEILAWMGADAQRWAEAFAQLHPDKGDPSLMIGWFANAMEAGARESRNAVSRVQDQIEEELTHGPIATYYALRMRNALEGTPVDDTFAPVKDGFGS
jgi:transposase